MSDRTTPITRRQLREAESKTKARKGNARPPRRKPAALAKRARSSLVSMGAMLFAAAMLIGLSTPANLFRSEASAVGDDQIMSSAEVGDVQSLAVADDAVAAAPARDGYSVTSYAELLRAKYSAVDYTYAATTGAVRWPFPYSVPVSSPFGPREEGFHKGVDFTPGGGSPIYAIADGVAAISTADDIYGQYVILTHSINGQRLDTLYAHMVFGSSPIVAGQEVKVGDFLGLVGDTGIAYGSHLHFEVRLDGVSVDPFAWLQANAVN